MFILLWATWAQIIEEFSIAFWVILARALIDELYNSSNRLSPSTILPNLDEQVFSILSILDSTCSMLFIIDVNR